MKALVDTYFPYATAIRVVLDNLNIHALPSLYEAFPPAEARRIAKKLEFHDTPKHGSWLNMVEAEIALVSRQALDQRLPDADAVRPVIAAWGASAQRRPGDGHLALHRHGRPAQAQAPVSDLIHPADH